MVETTITQRGEIRFDYRKQRKSVIIYLFDCNSNNFLIRLF